MEPVHHKRVATFNHSAWDLFVTVERQDNGKFRTVLVLGSGGSILGQNLSKRDAMKLAETLTIHPQ